jgi:16S rRNA (cytosine967-C5)-methyltransferase
MDPRDKRLATELVYGVLRTSRYLEKRIQRHAQSDRWRRKSVVRANMSIAVYSIAFLDRVPAHAAVSEAVSAIKASSDRGASGFANAVLRKIAREKSRVPLAEAVAQAVPRWLVSALDDSLGAEGTSAFIHTLEPPPLCLWVRSGHERKAVIAELASAAPDARFEASPLSPRGIRAFGAGDPKRLPGVDGAWVVQEEGAQLVALAAGVRSGDSVLDACAGRGGKTLVLGEAVGEGGAVDAADLHASKLDRLRAGPPGGIVRATYAVDWSRGPGDVPADYDRVLVDAPCSGVGTLRRRPEIAERLAASDVDRLAALQLRIAREASKRLRPGGRLVYAVCSVLGPECEGVVEALCKDGSLELAPFDAGLPLFEDKTQVRLLPNEHGTDGYFIASFVRQP